MGVGLGPYWLKDATGGRKPIYAKAGTVAPWPTSEMRRRCPVPVDNFFEEGDQGTEDQTAIRMAMKSDEPFALAAIWENWKISHTDEWLRTFSVITTTANKLVGQMVSLPPDAYDRWIANLEPDPRDLLVPFPSELMKLWSISTRANKPENDDPGILEPVRVEDDSTLL